MRMAVKSMLSGKSGYKPFSVRNTDYYVFYKPYKRSSVTGRAMEEVNWSAGIVYPEADIFGDYDSLLYYVLAITVLSLLLLFLLCRAIFRHQLTPLVMLAEKAQRLAEEHHDELIPDNSHSDEIARLQHNFRLMQQSLAANIGELEQLTTTLQERGEGLRAAYNEAKKADRMKTAFLHNMTNQMLAPATAIDNDVSKLCAGQGSRQCIGDILRNGNTIAELLNNLINMSDDEKGGRT
jgi:methyl-accepting chemotaxis protein